MNLFLNREEFSLGVVSVSAPIFSGDRQIAGAICIDIPTVRIANDHFIEQIAAEVIRTAQEISNIGSHNQLE